MRLRSSSAVAGGLFGRPLRRPAFDRRILCSPEPQELLFRHSSMMPCQPAALALLLVREVAVLEDHLDDRTGIMGCLYSHSRHTPDRRKAALKAENE